MLNGLVRCSVALECSDGFGAVDVESVEEGGGPTEVVALGIADTEAADGL